MSQNTIIEDPVERIERLLAANEHRAAWVQMIQLVEREPTTATCQAVADAAQRISAKDADLAPVRVSLLANFTAELMVPVLVAHSLSSRLVIDTYVPGYDTWIQEILDPSSALRKQDPEVIVLALQLEALSPALTWSFLELTPGQAVAEADAVADRIVSAVSTLRRWSRAKILLHTFPIPTLLALGILDIRLPVGQTAILRRLNDQLAVLTEQESDVYIVDINRLIGSVGEPRWHDARLWGMAKIPFTQTAVHALAYEYVRYLRAFKGLARKVLVLDLDNTLWGGILGEDGADGIRLGDHYPGSAFVNLQRVILSLHRRGVVLAINSKNNEYEVLEVLEKHPGMVLRPQHFSAMRINWQDKSANMIEIADELGLALDSFVFVDDSQVECERIRQAHPEIMTICLSGEPALRPAAILGLGVFDTLSYSDEDRQRGLLYRQEAERTRLRASAQSLEDFYRSLEMELEIDPVGCEQLQRAAELTQRTNQFNLTTRRYTMGDLASTLQTQGAEGYAFRLKDRFGDNGIIGLAILEGSGPRLCISTLLMSCRVLRRTVEDAILAFLVNRACERGAREIEGQFRPTRKNGQVSGFYSERNFRPVEPDSDTQRFIRDLAEPIKSPEWITVKRTATTEEA